MFKCSDVLNEESRGSPWPVSEAAGRVMWACELPQDLPRNKIALCNLLCSRWLNLNLHSNNFLLTVSKWWDESLLSPFVGKEQVHRSFSVNPGESWSTSCLGERCPLHVNSVWQRSFCYSSCQLAFVWMWNKLGVLKCWVSRSAVAPNSSAV